MQKWTEPLPKHTKLNYYECYAKIALSQLLSRNYENLILKDKPDLQFLDGSNGIEVTQAIELDQQKADSLYANILYNRVHNRERAIKEIEKCDCKYVDGILIGKPGTDSFDLILQALNRKLETINKGGFSPFCFYDLFIFSDIYADDIMRKQALQSMIDLSENYAVSFEKILVLVPGSLYIFVLPSKQIQVINYSDKIQREMACLAREMVEAAQP
ncbi:MAG: hypothetical protein HFG42_16675 [Lachnospiraceae bacterium]|jgi:hypothetical protein|nr:hypothetical protein [Lachnospiraceae bacterium]